MVSRWRCVLGYWVLTVVLTMDPRLGEGPLGRLEDVDVLLDHDRIDGHGKIVLPGFIDVHNHLWQTLIRGCATDKELNGWLSGCVPPVYSSAISSADSHAGACISHPCGR
jgi:5-methylthioadenosine/S-adenosylhomocysteine deaminase